MMSVVDRKKIHEELKPAARKIVDALVALEGENVSKDLLTAYKQAERLDELATRRNELGESAYDQALAYLGKTTRWAQKLIVIKRSYTADEVAQIAKLRSELGSSLSRTHLEVLATIHDQKRLHAQALKAWQTLDLSTDALIAWVAEKKGDASSDDTKEPAASKRTPMAVAKELRKALLKLEEVLTAIRPIAWTKCGTAELKILREAMDKIRGLGDKSTETLKALPEAKVLDAQIQSSDEETVTSSSKPAKPKTTKAAAAVPMRAEDLLGDLDDEPPAEAADELVDVRPNRPRPSKAKSKKGKPKAAATGPGAKRNRGRSAAV